MVVASSLAPTTALASEAALNIAGWPPSLFHQKPPIPPLKNSFYSMSQAATSTVQIDDQREEAIKNDSSMKSIVDGNGLLSDSLSRKRHRRRPSLFDLRRRRQRTEKNDNLRPRRIISVSEAIRRMKQVRVPPKCIFFSFAVENVSLSIFVEDFQFCRFSYRRRNKLV